MNESIKNSRYTAK